MIELTPTEILMLNYADTYTDGDNRFQGFWSFRYNVSDPQDLLYNLQKRGYIAIGDAAYQLQRLSATDIKKLLSDHGLKTSGKKADLIARLISSADISAIKSSLPRYYAITDKGASITSTPVSDCVLYLHRNQSLDDYGLNIYSVNDLLDEKGDYRKAIINHLLRQPKPPHYIIAEIYTEIADYENAFVFFITDLCVFLDGQQHQFHDPATAPVLARSIVRFIYPYETSLLRIPIGRIRALRGVVTTLQYDNVQLQKRIVQVVGQTATSQFFFTDNNYAQIIYSELQEDAETLTAVYSSAEHRFRAKYNL